METDLETFVGSKKTLMDRKYIRECIDTRFFGTSIDSMINKVAIDNRHCYLKWIKKLQTIWTLKVKWWPLMLSLPTTVSCLEAFLF